MTSTTKQIILLSNPYSNINLFRITEIPTSHILIWLHHEIADSRSQADSAVLMIGAQNGIQNQGTDKAYQKLQNWIIWEYNRNNTNHIQKKKHAFNRTTSEHILLIKNFSISLLTAKGRLNRVRFLHTFIFMLCLFIVLSIINREYIQQTDSALTIYLYVKSLQSLLLLALWTPSIIKRLHDIDIRGNRVWIAWAALLLDAHNLMLLNIHIAAILEKIQPILFAFYAMVLIFYLVLFLMPGSSGTNNWGGPQE